MYYKSSPLPLFHIHSSKFICYKSSTGIPFWNWNLCDFDKSYEGCFKAFNLLFMGFSEDKYNCMPTVGVMLLPVWKTWENWIGEASRYDSEYPCWRALFGHGRTWKIMGHYLVMWTINQGFLFLVGSKVYWGVWCSICIVNQLLWDVGKIKRSYWTAVPQIFVAR